MSSPFHRGSHRDLLKHATPPRASSDKVDAIIVPTARTAPYLRPAIHLAHELGCPLVVLCSRYASRAAVVKEVAASGLTVTLVAVDVPLKPPAAMPQFETSRLLARTKFLRKTDTSLKRNLGLMLAWMTGWQRVFFLDDDILIEDSADVRRAVSLLAQCDSVGLLMGGYPDNSVVCHANREAGGWQETFVGGGALAVPKRRFTSFFPNIYNEDWFFLLDDVELRPVAETGKAIHRPYDPFCWPERARLEEFGDVLAEGIFTMLGSRGRVQDADEHYWRDFLQKRAAFIADTLERVAKSDKISAGRTRVLASVRAALGRSLIIEPVDCVDFLQAWHADRKSWRSALSQLPKGLDVASAVHHVGLREGSAVRTFAMHGGVQRPGTTPTAPAAPTYPAKPT